MEIRNFVTFKKIVELGSFTKASQSLGYAQSTITTHIQQLEEGLGQAVFERLGHKLVLTAFGSELLEEVDRLLENYDRIERLGQLSRPPSATIRIGAEEAVMLYKMKSLFKDFKILCPDVEITLINEPYQILRKMLEDGDVDIIFIIDKKVRHKDFTVHEVAEEPMMFVSSPDYERKREEKVFRIPRIILTRKGGTYSSLFENYLREKNIIHEIVMEAWSLELVKQSLILGMGVSFLPEITVTEELASGQLVGETIHLSDKNRIYSQMIYHEKKQLSGPLKTLIDLVLRP